MSYNLYRICDSRGRLLYVGITRDPAQRFRRHADMQWWWDQVSAIYIERFATRGEQMTAERRAIRTEHPIYNRYLISQGKSAEEPFDLTYCPACGKKSFYRRELDRFYHYDGESNIDCWVTLASGRSGKYITDTYGRLVDPETDELIP